MLIIIQHVADLQFGKQFIGQCAFFAIECCSLRHKEHCKGATGTCRHIWPSCVIIRFGLVNRSSMVVLSSALPQHK